MNKVVLSMNKPTTPSSMRPAKRRRLPRSFKEFTPSHHFNPRSFFRELIWKAIFTPRVGQHRRPQFPRLAPGKLALTWIDLNNYISAEYTKPGIQTRGVQFTWCKACKEGRSGSCPCCNKN